MNRTLHGCEWHYEIKDGSDREAVLFLHGWGCTGDIFAPVMNGLKQYTLITLDFPGHGASQHPPVPWGVSDYAQGVLELLDSLGIKKCSVIAHSFGGRVALWIAAHHPERIRKMILCGSAGLRSKPDPAQQKKAAGYQRKKQLVQRLGRVPGLSGAAEKLMDALRNRYGSADYKALSPDMRETFVRIISEDLAPLLPDIKAPTLLIWGENDTETPLWMGRQMEKEIPDAGLVVFEGADHFAFLNQCGRFLTIAGVFLKDEPSETVN